MKNLKKYSEGITKNWNDHCEKLEDYCRRRQTKNRIAAIRKTIKYVKTGEADKELALLLNPKDFRKSSLQVG